jgi:ATP dependent DNA ligase C terminal region
MAMVIAHNSEVGENTSWDNVVADVRARGGQSFAIEPLDRQAIRTWFTSEIGRWPTETELDELETTTHRRAITLKLAIEAIRDGAAQPIQPDYAGYYERARRALNEQARTVAELLAVINRDTMVPRDLLAAAAENLGIANVGPALDQLHARRLLKANDGDLELIYAGKLEAGFSDDEKKRLLARLQELRTRKQPITASRSFAKARWVRPAVLIDAEFRGMTGDGLLRSTPDRTCYCYFSGTGPFPNRWSVLRTGVVRFDRIQRSAQIGGSVQN